MEPIEQHGATFKDADPARYTIADNTFLEAKDISAKATWLLIYLKSRPPGWVTRMSHLATVKTDGISAIRSAIRELIEAGYLFHSQARTADQQYANAVYLFSWYPRWKQEDSSTEPISENLISENLISENRTLVSTEVVSTEVTPISRQDPPSASPSASLPPKKQPKATREPGVYDEVFEAFWAAYPKRNGRKGSKFDAGKVWDKLSIMEQLQVVDNLPRYIVDLGDDFPKDAATWLRGPWRDSGPDSERVVHGRRDIKTVTTPFEQSRYGKKRTTLPVWFWDSPANHSSSPDPVVAFTEGAESLGLTLAEACAIGGRDPVTFKKLA